MRDLILIVLLSLLIVFGFLSKNEDTDIFSSLKGVFDTPEEHYVDKDEVDSDETDTRSNNAYRHSSSVTNPNRALPESNSSTSLLKNGDFEDSLNGWNYQTGVYWSDNGGKEKSGALLINAVEIESDSRIIHSKSVDQCIPLNNGSEFSIAANFRYLDTLPERPSVNRINVYWYDTKNCSRGGQFGSYAEPSLEKHNWQKIFRGSLVPALGAKAARIEIVQSQRGNNNAEAIWDNVSFAITSTLKPMISNDNGASEYTKLLGENYLPNSSFDNNLQHWWPPQSTRLNWRYLDNTAEGVMAATLPNDRDGSIGTGSFHQCVNIGTHQRFELGAKVTIAPESTNRGGGRLRPTWFEDLDCKGRHRTSSKHADIDPDNEGWQTLSVTQLTPLHNAKSVRISIIHSIKGRGEHTMLWDDFYFRAY